MSKITPSSAGASLKAVRAVTTRPSITVRNRPLDGKFGMFGRDWFWDINGVYGHNKAKQTMFGNINAANLQLALGPDTNCTGACVPFNIFGGEGSIAQACWTMSASSRTTSSKQELELQREHVGRADGPPRRRAGPGRRL
jgi:hypothetical protein